MFVVTKEQRYKCIIYTFFAFLILIIHIPMTYVADDLMMAPGVTDETLWEHFVTRYLYNGRICTDVLANAFYRVPMVVWKVFDTGIYVVIAMLISYLFTKNTYKEVLAVCGLILLFPFDYLSTAGYICVSTNYVYTILGILLILVPIKSTLDGVRVSVWGHIVSLFSIFYVTNHDQTAIVLIGGLFLYLIYVKTMKADKKLVHIIVGYFLASVCCYIFMFFMPGHINRMTSTVEMETWLPEYAEWTFVKKVYHGYTSTVAHIMYNNVKLFCLFCLLLFLVALQQKSVKNKLVAFIPVGAMLFVNVIGKQYFIHFDFVLPELLTLGEHIWNIVPLLLSGVILICIFYTVCTAVDKNTNKWLLILLLTLAAGSREMMGFSATIYASSYRTFTFFLYALIVCCLILLEELRRDGKKGM